MPVYRALSISPAHPRSSHSTRPFIEVFSHLLTCLVFAFDNLIIQHNMEQQPTQVLVDIYMPSHPDDPHHWAIFLESASHGDVILQIADDKGERGYYVDDPVENKKPQRSGRLEACILVGSVAAYNHAMAKALIQATPVDNDSNTWNCQAWVLEALNGLQAMDIFVWDKAQREILVGLRQDWQ